MRRDLAGHRQPPARARGDHQADGARVERCRKCSGRAGQAHEPEVARDDDAPRRAAGRPAQAQAPRPARPRSSTRPRRASASSQCWARRTPRGARVLEGPAHEDAVGHADAVVGEEAHARARPSRPSARGARPRDPSVIAPATATSTGVARAALEHVGDQRGAVERRLGVGHRDDRAVAAERRGARAALDRLGLLAPGLAQVGVEVDEARADPRSPRRRARRAPRGALDARRDLGDRARRSTSTSARAAAGRAHDRPAGDQDALTRPAPRCSPRGTGTAPPCAPGTPLATWRVTSARGRVGDARVDLDAAVHRARVHDQGVGAQPRGALGGEPVGGGELGELGTNGPGAALALEPQQRRRRRPQPSASSRSSATSTPQDSTRRRAAACPGAGHADRRAERGVRRDVAARDPAVAHVADDEDPQAVEELGTRSRRRACRGARPSASRTVNASSSPWVGCWCSPSPALMTRTCGTYRLTWTGAPLDAWRRTTASMPSASMVAMVSRRDSPFFTLARRDGQAQHVGAEALGRGLEAQPGPRRLLEEERGDDPALERRDLADGAPVDLDEALGDVEDLDDRLARQLAQVEEVCVRAATRSRAPPRSPIQTPSSVATIASTWRRRAGSCPRSRGGSAARGDPGRPGPRAGPRGAAPSRDSALSAARTVRPVKSTSSTSTTVRSVRSTGMSVTDASGSGRASRSSR